MPNQETAVPTAAVPSVGVLIPALNEEESIGLVLGDLPSPPVSRIVLVDNGSTDATAERARAGGAEVVEEPRRGYGQACLTGIAHYRETGAPDILVFCDGDYSDHPNELPQMIQPILDGEADMVIGSRMTGKREPGALLPQARFGNKLACWLMTLLWPRGYRFTDLGPFRAIRWEALEALGMCDTNFGWTVEMQLKALQHEKRGDFKICEIPVSYRKRVGVSKITGTINGTLRAGYKILYTIWKYRK